MDYFKEFWKLLVKHLGSLISGFVIPLLFSIISKLATSEIPLYRLDSVAEQASLSLIFCKTLKTCFLRAAAHMVLGPVFHKHYF